MMKYPENYAVLNEEEMEYTTGGSPMGLALVVGGVAGAVFGGILLSRKLEEIKAELKEKNPELYSATDAETTKKLARDASYAFDESAAGTAINAVVSLSGICIGLGISDLFLNNVRSV